MLYLVQTFSISAKVWETSSLRWRPTATIKAFKRLRGAAMESINGWIKAELFTDLHVTGEKPVKEEIYEYISFFNEQRPAYSLGYLTPKQYRESRGC